MAKFKSPSPYEKEMSVLLGPETYRRPLLLLLSLFAVGGAKAKAGRHKRRRLVGFGGQHAAPGDAVMATRDRVLGNTR